MLLILSYWNGKIYLDFVWRLQSKCFHIDQPDTLIIPCLLQALIHLQNFQWSETEMCPLNIYHTVVVFLKLSETSYYSNNENLDLTLICTEHKNVKRNKSLLKIAWQNTWSRRVAPILASNIRRISNDFLLYISR